MKLVILHYHLLPGGVTGVIVDATRAILQNLPQIDQITIACGRQDNSEAVRGLIVSGQDTANIRARVAIEIVPEFDYTEHGGSSSHDDIFRVISDRYCDAESLLWIHNFQLGKNPAFTRAVVDIALRRKNQRMILQIHDFPECARYENLFRLDNEISGTIYPSTENVRYAVINARDRDLLARSGIPSEQVFLVENPVAFSNPVPTVVSGSPGDKKSSVRNRLFTRFESKFPAIYRDHPILVYPIRTIRRKNVLEAGFLAAGSPILPNLLVTLPGVSLQERGYSDLVAQTFAEGLIPGMWGIGREVDALGLSFRDLVDASDMVVSSSVQEGFGYQFISALTWGKPLLARYLDILDSVLPVFSGFPHELYDSLLVPLRSPSIRSLRAYLSMRYQERLREIADFLPPDAIDSLSDEIGTMLARDLVDFSFLPVQVQYTLLKDLRDPKYRTEIQSLNNSLFGALSRLLQARPEALTGRVEGRFGYAAFARNFNSVIMSFGATRGSSTSATNNDTTVRRNLVRAFAHKEYVRLLYVPV